MLVLKEALFLLLSFLDLEFTKGKIAEYGVEIELNPWIVKLVKKFGITWGTSIGVLVPTLASAGVGWYHPALLTFLLGARSLLFILQLRTR